MNTSTSNYEMFFREYDPALGRMNQVDPMASKYASLTPYNYAFNDPVYYNDPLGDDARSSTRGGYSYASMGGCGCWRDSGPQDAGGGTSMYGSSWNYETYGGGFAKYGVGVSYGGMTGAQYSQMVRDAGNLNVGDYAVKYGTTVFTASGREMLWNPWAGSQNANGKYTGGWVGSSVHLVGLILEKGYKLKTKWQGGDFYIRKLSFKELDYDYGDGTRGIGLHVSFEFYPSEQQKGTYSNFNVIVLRDTHLGQPPVVDKFNMMNEGPFYWGDGGKGYNKTFGYLPIYGEFSTVVDGQSVVAESVQLQFFGLQGNTWVNLGEISFGYQYSNGTPSYYGPNIAPNNP